MLPPWCRHRLTRRHRQKNAIRVEKPDLHHETKPSLPSDGSTRNTNAQSRKLVHRGLCAWNAAAPRKFPQSKSAYRGVSLKSGDCEVKELGKRPCTASLGPAPWVCGGEKPSPDRSSVKNADQAAGGTVGPDHHCRRPGARAQSPDPQFAPRRRCARVTHTRLLIVGAQQYLTA